MPDPIQHLISRLAAGERIKYLFFWGHQPHRSGQITKTCLSQWWEQPFMVAGQTYYSAEHWMMAEKARLFQDEESLAEILATTSPAHAKKLGRQVRNFDAAQWKAACYKIVVEGNRHKFEQNPNLSDFLLSTNTRILVEASPFDRIWGIGLATDAPQIEDPATWQGQNLLGFALMDVRDQLIEAVNS